MKLLYDLLFGCTHQRTTFPQTHKKGITHTCCLDCGKKIPYSWEQMKVLKSA